MLSIEMHAAGRLDARLARAISRVPMKAVKGPTYPTGSPRSGQPETARRLRTYTRTGALAAVAALLLQAPLPAAASAEPLCDWLSGIGDAAQALAEGRAEDSEHAARQALAARPRAAAGARAEAALGLALAARGVPADAAAALELALAPSTAPARAHLSFLRAEALLASGAAPQAAALFAAAAAAPELAIARRARFREADALLAAGLAAEAVPALEHLLEAWPTDLAAPAARLALAAGRRALGDEAGAAEAYRALWLDADLPEARIAGAALASWRAAGGPVPPATADEHLVRADRLLAVGRPEEALTEVAEAREAEEAPAASGRAEALRAVALLALGQAGEAEQAAAPLAGDLDEGVRRTARWVLARAEARDGRLDEASRRYAEVAASGAPIAGLPAWRQRDVGDESAFLSAWLWYDAGQFAHAAETLAAFARQHPSSRRAEDALWFAAWSRYRLGDGPQAAQAFARLAHGPLVDAATYWQGRLARGARQRALYRAAAAVGGDGWYGLLARARLAALGERAPRPPVPPARPLPEAPEARASVRLSVAVEVLALGLEDLGLDELRDLARSARARPAAPLVAQLAAFAGDPELPFRMARDHLGPTRRSLRWAHPSPRPEVLAAGSRAFGIDPSLVLAVMRRESSFRPGVRSGAGAEGLMQLRPATAERLAALLGVPGGVGARLGDPGVSLELGAHYLGLLVARFGSPAVGVAAYNAGPRFAAEWARERAGMPLDAWVESIPFRETRLYVKIVLADWDVYRGLAGEDTAPIEPDRSVEPPADGVAF